MKTDQIKAQIEANAATIVRMHKRIHETFATKNRSSRDHSNWRRACADFHEQYDALAFPGGYAGAPKRILNGDPEAVEAGLCFVELRPYFFRSGYMFKTLLPKLKRADLSQSQRRRLDAVLERLAEWRESRNREKR